MRAGGIECANRVHFLALCAQIVRRLLVDHARKRGYAKRGGGAVRVTLDDGLAKANPSDEIDMMALDDALDALAKLDVRKSKLVELRYFGGLSVEEAAEALSISPETAKRDWRMAKAWLFSALAGSRPPAAGNKQTVHYLRRFDVHGVAIPFQYLSRKRAPLRMMFMEFVLACDMRFASRQSALFGQPEVGVGLVSGGGALEWLPRLVGRSRALEIVLSADDFDADIAERYGWVNRTVEEEAEPRLSLSIHSPGVWPRSTAKG